MPSIDDTSNFLLQNLLLKSFKVRDEQGHWPLCQFNASAIHSDVTLVSVISVPAGATMFCLRLRGPKCAKNFVPLIWTSEALLLPELLLPAQRPFVVGRVPYTASCQNVCGK